MNQTKSIKIAKLIAERTSLSRRAAEKIINDGKVLIDNKPAKVSDRVDERNVVILNGKVIPNAKPKTYIIFNKPRGFLVTKSDPQGRKTIWDLLPEFKDDLNSAGRLDKDSEGLLILTNDGDLISKITHPKFGIKKTYRVTVDGEINDDILKKFTAGIKLEDGVARAVSAKKIEKDIVELVLLEGKKREIRRMCKEILLKVKKLIRISIGCINIRDLGEGKFRYLDEDEISLIFS